MFSQLLLIQVAMVTGVTVLVTGLFLAPLSGQLDDQAMRRALAVAQTTASSRLAGDLLASRPAPDGPVQAEAERIRRATGSEYVVVMDARGVRWSHPNPARIGGVVSTDPSGALAGRDVLEIDSGTLGRSARGKVPRATATGGSSARCPSASRTTVCAPGSWRRSPASSRTRAGRWRRARWPRG
jgi:two-component system CitB family sensor kinase